MSGWPDPTANALDRARSVARTYRAALLHIAEQQTRILDDAARRVGEGWVCGVTAGETILTTAEVAAMLGITPRGVRLAVRRGGLEIAGQDDDGYLFERQEVLTYMATRARRGVA